MKIRTVFVVAALLSGISPSPSPAAELMKISGNEWAACKTEDDLSKFVKFATQKDADAITSMLLSGRCEPLKDGQEYYLEDIHMFSGKVEIRKKGSTQTLWTVYEATQKK